MPNGRQAWVEFSLTSSVERQARTSRVFTHLSCRTADTHGSSFHSPLVPNGRQARVEFSLTSRAERQAGTGRVFTHLSCRTAGTHRSSFGSPLVPNDRHARVEFSLTSRAEWQARTGRVFTHLSCRAAARTGRVFTHLLCRTAGTHGSSFYSPHMPNGRHAWSGFHSPLVPFNHLRQTNLFLSFPSNLQTNLLAWGLGGLHDHHRLTNDRRSFPGQNAGAQGQASPQPRSPSSIGNLGDYWGRLRTISPFANLRHGLPSNQPSRQSNSVILPRNFCQNLSEHVSISEDTPTSPTSKVPHQYPLLSSDPAPAQTFGHHGRRFSVNNEFAKFSQGGLLLDLRKKFEGIKFHDIYDLLLQVDQYKALLNEELQKNGLTSRLTFYRDLPKPSISRTTTIHVVNVEDMDSEERDEEVFLEEEEELAEVYLAEIMVSRLHVRKALSKASKDQRPTTVHIAKFSRTSQKGVGTKFYTFDISKAELILD
ncbi:unnamed protein product [Prunus armeniaca]